MPSDLPEIIEQRVDKAYASGGYGMTETLAVGSQAAGQVFDAKRICRREVADYGDPLYRCRG